MDFSSKSEYWVSTNLVLQSLAKRVAYFRHPINLRLFNRRVPALVETKLTPWLRRRLVGGGGGWPKPTTGHPQRLKQFLPRMSQVQTSLIWFPDPLPESVGNWLRLPHLGHQLLKGLVGGSLQHGPGHSEPSDRVHELPWFHGHRVLGGQISSKSDLLKPWEWFGRGRDGPAYCRNLAPSWSCWKCNPPEIL